MNTGDRSLPNNLQAERAILGAVLMDNTRIGDALALIGANDFFRDAHRRIFARMAEMSERREAIDLLTLMEALGRVGELDEVGGPAYLTTLVDGMPHGANVEHYARIVLEKSKLRALIAGANTMLTEAYGAEVAADDVLEQAERTILGLADRTISAGFESMRSIAPRALDALERAHANRGAVSGVATGFTDLDTLTRGLQPGTLVVLGARPGMGKTSFAQNVAHNAAAQGHVVGMFNLEMPNEELFIRQIAAQARLDSHRLQSGYVSDRDWGRISEAIGRIAEAPVYSDETSAIGIFEVRSRARRLKAEHGRLDLIILDYLQLMSTSGDYDSRALEIGAITGALKALAKELKLPVLLLSQLNRDQEKRGARPKLSDLRDSGSIEQDSDIVMFLYRAENSDQPDVTELIVAKHRNGPVGTIKLAWFEQQTRFDNHAAYEQPVDTRLPIGDR